MQKNKNQLLDIDFIIKKANISEGDKVADLGCGKYQYFVKPLAHLVGEKGLVYGVDIIKDTVEDIKKSAWEDNLKQVKALWSDLEVYKATKIDSSSIDRALLINVLNQSKKRVEIIKEAVRILKIGGLLIIVDWQLSASPFGPEPHQRINSELLKDSAYKLSLELKDEFSAGPYHFALIFNKL